MHRVEPHDTRYGLDAHVQCSLSLGSSLTAIYENKRNVHTNPLTCSTVTGTRAPWSSHIAVIPRLRAISPVRIEFGVHLVDVAEGLGFRVRASAMRVALNRRHCEKSCCGLGASAQCLSMVEN